MSNIELINKPVLDSLTFFRRFLDKAIENPYIPGDLRMVLNASDGRTYWSIIKDPYIDLATPCRMYLGKITGIYNEKINVLDQELSIEELIEDNFSIKLDKTTKNKLIKNWGKIRKLTKAVEDNPELYKVIKKRFDAISKVSKKYHVEINDTIDKENESIWIEVKRRISNLDVKEWVRIVIESIEILREIYKQIYGCTDDDQKYEERDKYNLIGQLIIHVSSIYKLALAFKNKVIWDHIGLSEWWGTSGSYIKLNLRCEEEISIDIHITRKLREAKPDRYDTTILIKAPNERVPYMQERLKLESKENKIYSRKKNLTLTKTIEEIDNIIQALIL